MRNTLTIARAGFKPAPTLLAAGIVLAMAFTFSCDNGGSDDNPPPAISSSDGSSVIGGGGSSSSSSNPGGSSSSALVLVGDKGAFIDSRDGQTYNWVKIGTQIWMAENLKYHEELLGKCYDNKEANCEKYGRLYEWDDAVRVCPSGWHLPTQSEWNALISFVGSDAGKKLKSTSYWRDSTGIDIYGFGALPGGILTFEFEKLNTEGTWWTSTEDRANTWLAYSKYMNADNSVGDGHNDRTNQRSVRCVEGYSSSSAIDSGIVIDNRDNKRYKTVKIGTQTWMAQNLNYDVEGSKCYNNKTENCNKYGRLYTWANAMDVPGDYNAQLFNAPPGQYQGICPEGWHLPTQSEWNALISFVNGSAGRKLKARSDEWGDNYGTDIYGFGALPGGILTFEFEKLNTEGTWWTSTQDRTNTWLAYSKYMNADNSVGDGHNDRTNQRSIRCVED